MVRPAAPLPPTPDSDTGTARESQESPPLATMAQGDVLTLSVPKARKMDSAWSTPKARKIIGEKKSPPLPVAVRTMDLTVTISVFTSFIASCSVTASL